MDWTQIILAIAGLFGAIDLGRLIFFKPSKRKAEAEATSAELTNESNIINEYQDYIAQLKKDRADAQTERDQYREMMEAAVKDKLSLLEEMNELKRKISAVERQLAEAQIKIYELESKAGINIGESNGNNQ